MDYKTITKQDIQKISTIVSQERVFTGDAIDPDFSHDELGTVSHQADLHIIVESKGEIQEIMRYANDNHIPVTVRGSGTGLVGACVPIYGGIILDMSKMNTILELDTINFTLRVEPGVLLMDIYEYVEKEGLFYAPDPGEKSATIGGNIATNAGGMRAVKYGVTRDWIRGLEIVTPTGDLLTFGGKVVKNSSGYSLKDLIIGSEGTLGIIVEATLKLIPKPQTAASLLIPFPNRDKAIEAVPKILRAQSLPTAVEFLESSSLLFSEQFLGKKIPHANYDAYLLLSYDADTTEELNHKINLISEKCVNDFEAIDVYLVDTEERKTSVWSARGAFLEAIKASTTEMDECDVVLPRSKVGDFLKFTTELSSKLDIRIPYFGHVGDGNLHIYFCKDELTEEEWQSKLTSGFEQMYNKAFEYGGLVSGEHGIGYAKKDYLKQQVGSTQMDLMRGIKQVFDPNNILNPGKII